MLKNPKASNRNSRKIETDGSAYSLLLKIFMEHAKWDIPT